MNRIFYVKILQFFNFVRLSFRVTPFTFFFFLIFENSWPNVCYLHKSLIFRKNFLSFSFTLFHAFTKISSEFFLAQMFSKHWPKNTFTYIIDSSDCNSFDAAHKMNIRCFIFFFNTIYCEKCLKS